MVVSARLLSWCTGVWADFLIDRVSGIPSGTHELA